MRRLAWGVLALVAAFAIWAAPSRPVEQRRQPSAPTTTQCWEDAPCWDCETMGNRVCGPVRVVIDDEGWVRVFDARDRLVFGPFATE